jgi:hypothetical protein
MWTSWSAGPLDSDGVGVCAVAVAGPEDPLHGVAAQRSLTGSPTGTTAGIDWMTT